MKSEIGTFFEAFPNGVVWGNTNNGQGYDLVLLGQQGDAPIKINVDEIQAKLNRPDYAPVVKSLRDRNLRLQYLAGLGLNLYESGPIYSEILRYRKFPDDMFVGQPKTIEALRSGIQRGLDYRE